MTLEFNAYNPGNSFNFNSSYKMRFHPIDKVWKPHNGADFSAATGTIIPAAALGTVYFVNPLSSYGNTVVLKHNIDGQIFYTLYAHLQSLPKLVVGQVVEAGQSVGPVGTTGKSSGPHLHFEVIQDQVILLFLVI